MIKYMKYEIQGTYKFMLGLILTVLVASTGLQLYGLNSLNNIRNSSSIDYFPTNAFLVTLLGMVIFGAFVTSLFYIVGSFRKELYEDRGYLTFSLPLTGKQILGSKLGIALMWAALLILTTSIYNLLLGSILFREMLIEQFIYIGNLVIENFSVVVGIILFSILSGIITLLLIYFSITLSKVSIKNKKLGGLWFIFFLIINSLIAYFTMLASNIIPYNIDLKSFVISNSNNLMDNMGMMMTTTFFMNPVTRGGVIVPSVEGIFINIGSAIFSIIIAIVLFLVTSNLLEKKIDL